MRRCSGRPGTRMSTARTASTGASTSSARSRPRRRRAHPRPRADARARHDARAPRRRRRPRALLRPRQALRGARRNAGARRPRTRCAAVRVARADGAAGSRPAGGSGSPAPQSSNGVTASRGRRSSAGASHRDRDLHARCGGDASASVLKRGSRMARTRSPARSSAEMVVDRMRMKGRARTARRRRCGTCGSSRAAPTTGESRSRQDGRRAPARAPSRAPSRPGRRCRRPSATR